METGEAGEVTIYPPSEQIDDDNHDSDVSVIPVQLIRINRCEEVTTLTSVASVVSPSSPSGTRNLFASEGSSNAIRGKYYKQTYRPAWEQMPDFAGWLRGVEGEPTRAYCTYCQKTLHAHRLSLLKHTCTIKHQKAAQLQGRKGFGKMLTPHHNSAELETSISEVSQGGSEGEQQFVEYSEAEQLEEDIEPTSELDHEEDSDEIESDTGELQEYPRKIRRIESQGQEKHYEQSSNSSDKPPISTQVTDTTKGTPISGLSVSLYKLIDGRWTYINDGVTNINGIYSQFLDRANFIPGRYKLHYDVDRYFESKKQESLYPFVEIVFDNTSFSEHYHIPLLLSPFGYTTYRGS